MKKLTLSLVLTFFTLVGIYAQEIAEVYIINKTKPFLMLEMEYKVEINGNKIDQVISRNSYLHCNVAPGLTTIRFAVITDGEESQGKSISLRLAKGEKGYVVIDGTIFMPFQCEILSPNKSKTIEKKIYKNKLFCMGDFTVKSQNDNYNIAKNTSVVKEIDNSIISDVDINIPTTTIRNDNTYVLIVANEEYSTLDKVNFAMKDGKFFKEYCKRTLGIPENNIRYSPNATYGMLAGDISWLEQALNDSEGANAIVYYCGHGIPNEKTGDAYLVPVDGNGTNTITCYSLNTLYTTLANTKASNVTYFMDACFTGANKEGSMLVAARGVAREAKKEILQGNSVVFSASSGDETAMTYKEKAHGMFTYFLLKKLQETKGNVSYSELAEYISNNVKKESLLINNKPQTPVIATSPSAVSTWKDMKLK